MPRRTAAKHRRRSALRAQRYQERADCLRSMARHAQDPEARTVLQRIARQYAVRAKQPDALTEGGT